MTENSERIILDKLGELGTLVGRLDERVATVFQHYASREDVTKAIKCHEQEKHGSGSFRRPRSTSGSPFRDTSTWVKIGALIGGLIAAALAGAQL